MIQYYEETDEEFRHAGIDLFLGSRTTIAASERTRCGRWRATSSSTAATTGSRSTLPPTTSARSAATRRPASSGSGSCASTGSTPTASGATASARSARDRTRVTRLVLNQHKHPRHAPRPRASGLCLKQHKAGLLGEGGRAVVADRPVRVVRDLPRVAVWVDEDARVAAPERLGAVARDRGARCLRLGDDCVDLGRRADVVARG